MSDYNVAAAIYLARSLRDLRFLDVLLSVRRLGDEGHSLYKLVKKEHDGCTALVRRLHALRPCSEAEAQALCVEAQVFVENEEVLVDAKRKLARSTKGRNDLAVYMILSCYNWACKHPAQPLWGQRRRDMLALGKMESGEQ